MDCQHCGTDAVTFAVPPEYREYLRGDENAAGLCPVCLTLQPVSDQAPDDPDFSALGDVWPTAREAAIPLALLVGMLDNLALHRAEITDLIAAVEMAGVDPMLVLDRLAEAPGIDAKTDLRGRRRQLEQLL